MGAERGTHATGVTTGATGVGGLAGQLTAGARRTSQVTYSAMGSPLATSGRFCRRIQPERPRSGSVSPGQRSRQRTTPAENRTETKDPWQNQGPFPAEPPRSRMATVNANRGRRCVQKEACVSQSCIPNTPPSPVHQINAISMPGTPFQFANPFQRVCFMAGCSGRIGRRCDPDALLKILKHAVDDRLNIRCGQSPGNSLGGDIGPCKLPGVYHPVHAHGKKRRRGSTSAMGTSS